MSPDPFAPVAEVAAGPEPDAPPAEIPDEDPSAEEVVDGGAAASEPDAAPVDSGEMFEGHPVVTLEYELWSAAFAVRPPPPDGEWEAVQVGEMMSVNTPDGVVYAMVGDYLVRAKGAGATEFVCLSPEAFASGYQTV